MGRAVSAVMVCLSAVTATPVWAQGYLKNPDLEAGNAHWSGMGLARHDRYKQPSYAGGERGANFGVVFSTGEGSLQQTALVFKPMLRYQFSAAIGRFDAPGAYQFQIGYLKDGKTPQQFVPVATQNYNSDGRRFWLRTTGVTLITSPKAEYISGKRKVAVRFLPRLPRKGAIWCDDFRLQVGQPSPRELARVIQSAEELLVDEGGVQ